ncbi:MAG: hypothetical protein Q8M26_08585 [Pseudolabrys sp.]|nr:hypothetical protein [Pseudolabrys sp.]
MAFEDDLRTAMGADIQNDEIATQVWSALANVTWYHPESKQEAGYSFRAAGGLIADLRGNGDYMDWYCSGPYATVSDRIGRAMKKLGWIADTMPEICDEPGCLEFVSCWTPTEGGYRNTCGKHQPERAALKNR